LANEMQMQLVFQQMDAMFLLYPEGQPKLQQRTTEHNIKFRL